MFYLCEKALIPTIPQGTVGNNKELGLSMGPKKLTLVNELCLFSGQCIAPTLTIIVKLLYFKVKRGREREEKLYSIDISLFPWVNYKTQHS